MFFDLWGLTEGTPLTSYDPARDTMIQPESCGRALPGCEIRIADPSGALLGPGEVGEVVARSPSLMNGYYNNPQATAETIIDGFLQTGDLGKLDEQGFLYILGRKKDLIIRGGLNVYPSEIEEVLYGRAEIAECAVVGKPDEVFGETVTAYVVLKPDCSLDADDLRRYCAGLMSAYKIPSEFLFVTTLPKGPTGKILKRALRAA